MSELTITDANFESEVLKNKKPVLVDFWAPWCGPCQMMGPIIEEVAKDMGEKAAIGKLNVDENQVAAEKYGVSSIPTIIFFKNGEEVERMIGVRGKDELIKKLEELIVS
jgi:thioredoxin 1